MVYCSYCGTQNNEGSLKCIKCGKPLSLFSNQDSILERNNYSSSNSPIKNKYQNIENKNNDYGNIDRNIRKKEENNFKNNSNLNWPNNRKNQNIPENNYYENTQKKQYRNDSNSNRNLNQNISPENINSGRPLQRTIHSNKNFNNDYYNPNTSQNHYQEVNNREISKTTIEWDVVIATALLVIILSAILGRFLPNFAIFISLLVGLIYILIATKSKSSLMKSIPLVIIMILAVSAYFSI